MNEEKVKLRGVNLKGRVDFDFPRECKKKQVKSATFLQECAWTEQEQKEMTIFS